ncbi:MAG: M48 family metallopeptidase [Hyphomonadaceae bacterium]|nr:M48 family metallopeptidase [Hyphomonadaceae bacterium]
MHARYADGRAAIFSDVEVELAAETLIIRRGDRTITWSYADLARADDKNGRIVIRPKKPDTGERLMFGDGYDDQLAAAAPHLMKPRAQGVEGRKTVGALVALSWSLAAIFLIGIPFAADPMARALPAKYRAQISDISWSQVDAFTVQCDDADEATQILNNLAYRIMEASNVPEREDIWITIADAGFPNAFALPDNSIIVTDDLIRMADHPDELTGVLAHEIAHIEHNHIMKNVVRQISAGIFFDVVFGGAGAGQAIAYASVNLAGLRFSRGDESDADSRGMDYLDAANISTGGIARMFDRFQEYEEEAGVGDIPSMLSSHPASRERALAAQARAREGLAPSLTDREWRIVQHACGGADAIASEAEVAD